jgi:metal-dependent amidase/aminoacylase/carboxypeptidase family protein
MKTTGGEDFSLYAKYPGAFALLGSGNKERQRLRTTRCFNIDERVMAALNATDHYAWRYLRKTRFNRPLPRRRSGNITFPPCHGKMPCR